MEKYNVYDEKFIVNPMGLNNKGTTCWFNSMIQIFLSIPSLTKDLLENEPIFKENAFIVAYINLLKTAKDNASVDKLTNAAYNVYNVFTNTAAVKKTAFGSRQECADEGFTLFMACFQDKVIEDLFTVAYECVLHCTTCNINTSITRDITLKIDIKHNYKFESQEDFCNYLRVHGEPCDEYTCDICHTRIVNACRISKLKMIREMIVITLGKWEKKTMIWFPETLTFPNVHGGSFSYKLIGCIIHRGTASSGHYWANVLRNGVWYNINDSVVNRLDKITPSEETYMLFYHMT